MKQPKRRGGRGLDTIKRLIVPVSGALALGVGLGGCGTALTRSAPDPDRPEIASVGQETNRVRSGCPIRFSVRLPRRRGHVRPAPRP
jgi:hypothetical protein